MRVFFQNVCTFYIPLPAGPVLEAMQSIKSFRQHLQDIWELVHGSLHFVCEMRVLACCFQCLGTFTWNVIVLLLPQLVLRTGVRLTSGGANLETAICCAPTSWVGLKQLTLNGLSLLQRSWKNAVMAMHCSECAKTACIMYTIDC